MRFLTDRDTQDKLTAIGLKNAEAMGIAFAFHDDCRRIRYDWHTHDHHQLLYAFSGVMSLETQDRRFILPPHRAAWIPAGRKHRPWLEDAEIVSVFFPPRLLGDIADQQDLRILAVPPVIREMLLYSRRWPPGRHRDDPVADTFFMALGRVCLDATAVEMPYFLPRPRTPAVGRAMDYAQAHPADADLKAAAVAAAMSERTLRRHFVAETGMGWQDYLHKSRMLKAMLLLADPAVSVTHAAEAVGFTNLSAFAKAFTAFTGELPSRYRKTSQRDHPNAKDATAKTP